MLTFQDVLKEGPPPYQIILGGYETGNVANNLTDKSGHNRPGDTSSTTMIVSGPPGVGKAQRVSPNDYFNTPVAPHPAAAFTSATHLAWIRGTGGTINSTIQIAGGAYKYLLNYYNRPTDGKITMYFGVDNESEALVSSGSPAWNDGKWHMLTWQFEDNFSTDRQLFYMDGILDAVRNRAGNAPLGGSFDFTVYANTTTDLACAAVVSWNRTADAVLHPAPAFLRRLYLAGIGALEE